MDVQGSPAWVPQAASIWALWAPHGAGCSGRGTMTGRGAKLGVSRTIALLKAQRRVSGVDRTGNHVVTEGVAGEGWVGGLVADS